MRTDRSGRPKKLRDVLEPLGEITGCFKYGRGSGTMSATPAGPPRLVGRDDHGNEVRRRRFRRAAGHWYEVETSPPQTEEANRRDIHAALQVSESASCWRR